MQIGVVGLGRMGGNIVRRLIRHGHQAVVHDRNSNAHIEPDVQHKVAQP